MVIPFLALLDWWEPCSLNLNFNKLYATFFWVNLQVIFFFYDEQFRQLRRKVNSTLQNIRPHIWHDYKAVIFTLDMANAKRIGVHLDSKKSSSEYSLQIVKAAGKLVCTNCNFNPTYDKNQHKHDSLIEPCIEQAQP